MVVTIKNDYGLSLPTYCNNSFVECSAPLKLSRGYTVRFIYRCPSCGSEYVTDISGNWIETRYEQVLGDVYR